MSNLFEAIGDGLGAAGRFARRARGMEGQVKQRQAMTDYYSTQTETARQEAEQRSMAARRAAMVQDARQVNQLLKNGNVDAATMLVQDRLDQLNQLGADPKDTQRLNDMLYNGDINSAIAATDAVVQMGYEAGLLEPQEAPGEGGSAPLYSAKTDLLPGGLAVMTNNAGDIMVKTADGRTLRGQEAVNAVERARRLGAEEQGLRAGERAAGTQAVERSGEMFDQLQGVQTSIRLLSEAEAALDQGAATGPIMSRLPTVTDASAALDQVQRELGLNVLQNTTFGALSKDELRFALETGLPQNMRPDELRKWIKRKREAQQKLSYYLGEAAYYLGQPGNTVADFIQMKKEQSKQNTFTWGELTGESQ